MANEAEDIFNFDEEEGEEVDDLWDEGEEDKEDTSSNPEDAVEEEIDYIE